jgi:hypothetical protein
MLQLCVLRFEGSGAADDALDEVIELEGARHHWLLEVGSVARPLIGRLRVGATFLDGESATLHEGDLADAIADLGGYTGYYVSALAGPVASLLDATEARRAAQAYGRAGEERLFHLEEVKRALPRDSSALVLIADPRICDAMVEMFSAYSPNVLRRDVSDQLRARLRLVALRAAQMTGQIELGTTSPAPH